VTDWHRLTIVLPLVYCPVDDDTLFEGSQDLCCFGQVKSLLLLWKPRRWFLAILKTFTAVDWELNKVAFYQKLLVNFVNWTNLLIDVRRITVVSPRGQRRQAKYCFWLPMFVCLFLCQQDYWKMVKTVAIKRSEQTGNSSGIMRINFGANWSEIYINWPKSCE